MIASESQPDFGGDRATFMDRVRAALGRDAQTSPPPPLQVDVEQARLLGYGDDLVGLFAERAQEIGMHVRRIRRDALLDTLDAVLSEHKAKRVVVGAADAESIGKRLVSNGYEIVDWQAPDGIDRQFDADAGITDVHAALAETGTLICHSGSAHSRGPSLLPPLHVAIVSASDVLPDMIDYWQQVKADKPGDLPSSMVMITGPSKTGDIEGVLIEGVHGPQQVHILLIEDG
jgi:L-lactate dehydrogenase complex protein LldG